MIDSLKTECHGRITIVKINVDASKKLAKELGIVGVPYLELYYNGIAEFYRYVLIKRDELEKLFENSINEYTNNQYIKN